jgi:hypothetical protein
MRPLFRNSLALCFVSDQTFQAGNTNSCYKLHARCGLRLTIRLQEEILIVPTRARVGYFQKAYFLVFYVVRVTLAVPITFDDEIP